MRRTANAETAQKVRSIDPFDGETATEIKNYTGPLGQKQFDQFETYVAMVKGKVKVPFQGELRQVKRVKYVFTHPDGARANRKFIREALERYEQFLSFELFDRAGVRVLVETEDDFDAFLKKIERMP